MLQEENASWDKGARNIVFDVILVETTVVFKFLSIDCKIIKQK